MWYPPKERRQDWIWPTALVLAASVAAAPFHQHDWPNPRGPYSARQDFVASSPIVLLSATPSPFIQSDWPNPSGPEFPIVLRGFVAPQILVLVDSGAKPFLQSDWPNPRGYETAVELRTWNQNLSESTLAPIPPYIQRQSDWQNPRGPEFPSHLRSYSVNLQQTTLAPPFVPTISVILTDAANAVIAGLTGLRWAWWDDPIVNSQVAPTVTGTGASTDGSGVFSVTTLSGSALTAGQTGWIEITDSDGTVGQTPVGKIAGGPVEVS